MNYDRHYERMVRIDMCSQKNLTYLDHIPDHEGHSQDHLELQKSIQNTRNRTFFIQIVINLKINRQLYYHFLDYSDRLVIHMTVVVHRNPLDCYSSYCCCHCSTSLGYQFDVIHCGLSCLYLFIPKSIRNIYSTSVLLNYNQL